MQIYLLVPSVASARAVVDELPAAGVEERRARAVAKDDTLPEDLLETGAAQKSDPSRPCCVAAGGVVRAAVPSSDRLRSMGANAMDDTSFSAQHPADRRVVIFVGNVIVSGRWKAIADRGDDAAWPLRWRRDSRSTGGSGVGAKSSAPWRRSRP